MQRAARSVWGIRIPGVRKGLFPSLPLSSCCHRIPLSSTLRTTFAPHRTVMSSSQWTCTPRVFPNSGFELLAQSIELDEEALPTYQPEKYYPANQGEILNGRLSSPCQDRVRRNLNRVACERLDVGAGNVLPAIQIIVIRIIWYKPTNSASTDVVWKLYVTGQNRDHKRELDIYKHMNLQEAKTSWQKLHSQTARPFLYSGPAREPFRRSGCHYSGIPLGTLLEITRNRDAMTPSLYLASFVENYSKSSGAGALNKLALSIGVAVHRSPSRNLPLTHLPPPPRVISIHTRRSTAITLAKQALSMVNV
ncbi:hypothetical protein ABOM_003288 [Aspergillus bombycis]|uniref:Uncharacterized protein n=1 Tax=Aspergillus bombycis TaxID=109264 RepID=A0A1F8A7Z8_9EURO|nr:hypothetical protein ABOM_003288 [Aspergillus bombycis]OGM47836.1 hypothetical protein ABOM_003288 [Aspergillus bombycis]